MKSLKTLLLSATCGLLTLISTSSQAQNSGGAAIGYVPTTLLFSSATNFVLPGPTNATAGIINGGFPSVRNVGFQLTSASTATNAGTITAVLVRSIDGIIWETNTPFASVTNVWTANSATNRISNCTNFDLGAFQYVTVFYITNSSGAGAATNMSLAFTIKPGL
jgi:hypothetical protein